MPNQDGMQLASCASSHCMLSQVIKSQAQSYFVAMTMRWCVTIKVIKMPEKAKQNVHKNDKQLKNNAPSAAVFSL